MARRPWRLLCYALLPPIDSLFASACADPKAYVNCTSFCLNPDWSSNFHPELLHTHLNNSQVKATMENTTSLNDGPKSLRILCFGDSLTAGYSEYGYFHYPYAKRLQAPLENYLPLTKITVDVAGLSGDRVIAGQYLRRMQAQCVNAEEKPYDWIIVLGGTNDLGWSELPEKIYEGLSMILALDSAIPNAYQEFPLLEKVWRVALDSGANVLALNVLEAEVTSGTIVQRRNELNKLIASHEEDRWWVSFQDFAIF